MKHTTLFLLSILLIAMHGHILAAPARVTINVTPPAETPAGSVIFIVGNDSLLGSWDAGKVPMTKGAGSLWTISLEFRRGVSLEFKITRGSWESEAIYMEGEVPSNTTLTVDRDTIITLLPVTWRDLGFKTDDAGGITGTVRHHAALEGKGLDYKRDLTVWLPPSYATDTTKRYAVLYMHDGQNIFNPATSFTRHDWRVDEVADSLIRAGSMEEIIVVAIDNTPDRGEEYDDTTKGDAYMQFVVDVVKPLIDSAYRTKPGRENTGTMGSSSGGLIAFLMAWKHPETFSKAACISPAFFEKVRGEVKSDTLPDRNIRIYIDNGSVGLEARLQPGCDRMMDILEKKGFVMHKNLEWFHDLNAEHNERAWAGRVWRPLLFMFGH